MASSIDALDREALRALAVKNLIPTEELNPAALAAIEEMRVTAPERASRILDSLYGPLND